MMGVIRGGKKRLRKRKRRTNSNWEEVCQQRLNETPGKRDEREKKPKRKSNQGSRRGEEEIPPRSGSMPKPVRVDEKGEKGKRGADRDQDPKTKSSFDQEKREKQ